MIRTRGTSLFLLGGSLLLGAASTGSPLSAACLKVDTDVPADFVYSDDYLRVEAWDCADLSWWTPSSAQKVVQTSYTSGSCDEVETEYYDCYALLGNDMQYRDLDGDGFTPADGDCDDFDATVGDDANGDGLSDCLDYDDDGFTGEAGDCDDWSRTVVGVDLDGDATSDCQDDDGDGLTELQGDCSDEDPAMGYVDADGDGTSDCDDYDQDGWSEQQGDCDDRDWDSALQDVDADGSPDCIDDDRDGADEAHGDCNDLSAQVGPTQAEAIGDGIDNDCDGLVDELEASRQGGIAP